jgi:hypothetical protein
MPSRSRAVPVEVLRSALKNRVEETSLRATAAEVGLSWKGIDKLIGGTDPQPGTIRKLTDWYVRQSAQNNEEPTPETAQAALAVIVRHLPPSLQDDTVAKVIELLRETVTEHDLSQPEWLRIAPD